MTDETTPSSGGSSSNTLMLILAYLWILAIIPLLVEKENKELQWHAKHGLVIFGAEIILYFISGIIQIVPILGTMIGCILIPIIGLAGIIVRMMALMKAFNGERMIIPNVSEYADRF